MLDGLLYTCIDHCLVLLNVCSRADLRANFNVRPQHRYSQISRDLDYQKKYIVHLLTSFYF